MALSGAADPERSGRDEEARLLYMYLALARTNTLRNREISARAPKGHKTAACAYRIVTVTHVVWYVFRISWYVYGYAHLRATDED